MPKFRCYRSVISASGDQEFEVEANSVEEARALFIIGEGEMVADNSEVTHLSEYELDDIWEEV